MGTRRPPTADLTARFARTSLYVLPMEAGAGGLLAAIRTYSSLFLRITLDLSMSCSVFSLTLDSLALDKTNEPSLSVPFVALCKVDATSDWVYLLRFTCSSDTVYYVSFAFTAYLAYLDLDLLALPTMLIGA